ncbi:Type II secretion system protein G precursor [Pseudobythopirellula maris]|uniref:Type II secretion system protein G n=1 Tax=Pseudobythopirellula maris TaxID=2527991 RepID=A0A5C5ZSF9_9BACT|nr:prepilin-type N-terminal cleavage/methylation domain-containing protein [Pseudobythopirellula maris]TWT89917.1 Type II secretion system protein G precursor [Pseudobythopirellula maris]
MATRKNKGRGGFSLMELLAVVTILGVIAAIVVPRVTVSTTTAKEKVDAHNRATLNSAIERYYIATNDWPSANLTELNTTDYFPDGLPENPLNASAPYAMDATSKRIAP